MKPPRLDWDERAFLNLIISPHRFRGCWFASSRAPSRIKTTGGTFRNLEAAAAYLLPELLFICKPLLVLVELSPGLFQGDLNEGVCILKYPKCLAARGPGSRPLGARSNLNWENSFKSVATSLAAPDNDDTIPLKLLAANKSVHGTHKSRFLNGHKGAVSTPACRPLLWPRLKIFLKAGRSWHVEISYTDVLRRLNAFILCIFVSKVTIESQILPNDFLPHWKMFLISLMWTYSCISTSFTLFSCFHSSPLLLKKALKIPRTCTNGEGRAQDGPPGRNAFVWDHTELTFLWVPWSPGLLILLIQR